MPMIQTIKNNIRASSFYYEIINPIRQRTQLYRWQRSGRPVPPPHLAKRAVVLEYAARFNLRTFVETGTSLGYMVGGVKDAFDRVISIEIDPWLFAVATRRFARYRHVSILHGDSSEVLERVTAGLAQPCLFWLDAHEAAPHLRPRFEPPIMQELDIVLAHSLRGHVILIDDARNFTGRNQYPSVEDVAAFAARRGDWRLELADDIICLCPGT